MVKSLAGFMAIIFIFAGAVTAGADTVQLKNGDRLTGTIEGADGKQITLKTDYAGVVSVKWDAVAEVTSKEALFVATPQNSMVKGELTSEGAELVVHTEKDSLVRVPISGVKIIRSIQSQAGYEKGLHPSLLESWKGSANVGLALARGNNQTTNYSLGFNSARKTQEDQITLHASSIYSANSTSTASVTSTTVLGGWRYDRNATARIFGFGSGEYAHNSLQYLDLQSIYSVGFGVHAIKSPQTTLDLLGGANYTRETYDGGAVVAGTLPPGGLVRNLGGATIGDDFTRKFSSAFALNEHFYVYPDFTELGQYRFALDAGAVTKITKWLGWQVTVSDRYVSNPPVAGTKANDVIFTTGLNLAFEH